MTVFVVTTNNQKYSSEISDVVRVFDSYEKAAAFVADLKELCHHGIKLTEREVQ